MDTDTRSRLTSQFATPLAKCASTKSRMTESESGEMGATDASRVRVCVNITGERSYQHY